MPLNNNPTPDQLQALLEEAFEHENELRRETQAHDLPPNHREVLSQ